MSDNACASVRRRAPVNDAWRMARCSASALRPCCAANCFNLLISRSSRLRTIKLAMPVTVGIYNMISMIARFVLRASRKSQRQNGVRVLARSVLEENARRRGHTGGGVRSCNATRSKGSVRFLATLRAWRSSRCNDIVATRGKRHRTRKVALAINSRIK